MKKKVVRLFEQLQPTHYELSLTLDPEKSCFSGTVTIKAKRRGKPSRRITLHQKGLKIQRALVAKHDKHGDQEIEIDRINTHDRYDEVRLHSPTLFYAGDYTIILEFSGFITDQMNGLYPCYFTHDGKEKRLLATQFESHHAREVFPCIDEPEAKAVFEVKLDTPAAHGIALSNTPIKAQNTKGDRLLTEFEPTPLMSTYLLAVVTGELGYKEARTARGTAVRAYATPDNVAHLDFAVETGVRCLEFYEEYFDIPYPLQKSDMVALPDFASGAMENWGLITYREQALLVDERNTSTHIKQHVAMVVAHELAHMWFGNLVTMRWWTDLWLNEGFASWIEYLAVDTLFPEWDMWTQFVADEQAVGLKLDGLEHTHPVEVPINHPDEIRTIFDAISYQKGSSVIHMLHDYLGPELFRDGLRYYLSQHAYKNTDTVDLWAALETVSKKPVKAFMHAWTSQPGYPIVKATITDEQISLTQQRFVTNPHFKESTPLTWPVPLLARPLLEPDTFSEATSTRKYKPGDTPLVMNQGHRGFYRTVYDATHLTQLAKTIPTLSAADRLGIIGDAFEAAKAGMSETVSALSLIRSYETEEHTSVWDIIATNLAELRRVMDDDSVREHLKPLVQNLIKSQYERLGWDSTPDDSHVDRLLRPTILGLATSAELPDALQEVKKRFEKMKRSEDLAPDIRGVVYATSARYGDEVTFRKLLAMHNTSDSAEERVTLASAITNFEQANLIDKALELIKTKTVRAQDLAYWLVYSFGNRHAKRATWEWLQAEWEWLESQIGTDLSFYRTPVYVARSFSDAAFKKEYEEFFMPKMSPALERGINQGLEIIAWQSAWKERDLDAVKRFLAQD